MCPSGMFYVGVSPIAHRLSDGVLFRLISSESIGWRPVRAGGHADQQRERECTGAAPHSLEHGRERITSILNTWSLILHSLNLAIRQRQRGQHLSSRGASYFLPHMVKRSGCLPIVTGRLGSHAGFSG